MAIYSDVNQYTPTAKETVDNIESVYQSIDNILSTNVGERMFNKLGSELEGILHEIMDDTTVFEIYSYVIRAIDTWEPRVQLNYGQCRVTPNYAEQKYNVILVFTITGLGDQEFVYEGALEE